MDITLVLYHLHVVCLVIASVIAQENVCVNFKTLNSTILKTDYTGLSRGVSIPPDWYKYTGTTSGVVATSCPTQSNACGAKNQIWIEGALPTFGSGIQQIPSCVRTDRNGVVNCCGLKNALEIANCNSFFVYHLTPTAPSSNYCFNATAPDLSTVTMPQTTTHDTSQDTTSTRTILPLTTQTRHNTTIVSSTITFLQTTSVNNTPTDADLSTVTMPQTTKQDTTAPDLSTVTMSKTTTQDPTSTRTTPPLTTHTRHNTTPVPSTITFELTTSANNTITAGSSESKEQSTEPPELLIGIVTGSAVGCVVVIIAVIAAVVYIKRFRGDQNVTYRANTAIEHRTSEPWIQNTRFKIQRP